MIKCNLSVGSVYHRTSRYLSIGVQLYVLWLSSLYLMQLETSSFMEEFGLPSKTRTKDGYNPLLDDFKNTKFFLSVPTHNIK